MTLTEFLLARIAEREDAARVVRDGTLEVVGDDVGELAAARRILDPARVLAECEAKRRIVEEECDGEFLACFYLAAVDADHPDYRGEWRP